MAQSYTTDDGITLYEPGTVVSQRVIAGQGGIAAAGVVTLLGEAEEGPHWSEEEDLDRNVFGPDDIAGVTRKYGSGRLVDAFRAIVAAANDPAIVGAVSAIKIVKTNASELASAYLVRPGFGNYAEISARRAGTPGNLIKYRSETSQAEVAPTTGEFSYCPHLSGTPVEFGLRTNGGDQKTISVAASTAPDVLAAAISDIDKGILATGGDREDPLASKAGITLTAAAPDAETLTVTLATGNQYSPTPEIGDVAIIPAAGTYSATVSSVIAGTSSENIGSYVVTGVVNTASSATLTLKAINITGANTVAASGPVSANEDDLIIYKPMEISNQTGMDRDVAAGLTPNWTCTLNDGTNFSLSTDEAWTNQPQVGDTFKLSSAFAGIAAGFYVVTGSTSTTVSGSRLSPGSSGTTGSEAATAAGFTVEKPVIDGLGKSLEFDGDVDSIFKTESGEDTVLSDNFLISSAEYINSTTISRGTVEDSFEAGGNVYMTVGTTKADAKVVIDDEKMEFFEGATSVFELSFEQYKTLSDAVGFINSQSDYSAALGSSQYASVAPANLDNGTFEISSTGWRPGRIKADAMAWQSATNQSGLATTALASGSGLPEESTPDKFLSGGLRGGTSSLDVTNAIDACDYVITNFVVSLFSVDAADDIASGDTDSSSTYTIDAINALMRNHALKNSALKAKKNRHCFVSKTGPYADQKEAAADSSSFRVPFCIQDCKVPNSSGQIQQYQPWMSSVIAAGMQAAAGYKGIVKKFANVSGVLHANGDWNPKLLSDREDALKAGLLVMEPVNTGGFRWISDQTSYTVDNNFVFNSLQASYIADLMALSLIEAFDRSVVGKSVAEISAAAALGFLESQLFNFRRLKWITASDDAPKGWKNASIKIQGGVMRVSVEVKLAGLIYFVPIDFAISEVTQEATQ